ncbi:MAG: hypothetical protein JWS12_233 [Candidatus Saccharibacteria bacterium]|nr:hypothetical protein [Candidatus Saccharibacteria bacterium]
MKIRKPLLIVGVTSAVALASLAGAASVSAASSTTGGSSSLVDKIAAKFNLNKNDVKAVFDQNRTDHQAAMDAQAETDLSKAVTDGKLTADQKSKILAKRAELKTQRAANRGAAQTKSAAERQAAMQTRQTELATWAKDNNIPTDYLRYVSGGSGHRQGN